MIGFILCLPATIIFSLVMLDIEPHFGPLQPLLIADDGHPGELIPLGALSLLPVAVFVSIVPIRRSLRSGGTLLSHPMNLALAVAILSFTTTFVVGVIVDQYPCWIGVPNCD
jgi:hypothetical protein